MKAVDFIQAGIPQDMYIDSLKEHFPLSFREYVNRFNLQPGEYGFYSNQSFHEQSFDLFEHHNILPVMIPELYATGVNWNVSLSIHKDIVSEPEREYQRDHFASGTGQYGDNHEFPNLSHAKNFARILGYVCLERKLAILERVRPDLEVWYKDPTGCEELRQQELEQIWAKRALSGENVPRKYRPTRMEKPRSRAERTSGDEKNASTDFSSEV